MRNLPLAHYMQKPNFTVADMSRPVHYLNNSFAPRADEAFD